MRVLVACEESQAVTIEMRKLGHEAYSCDIQACSGGHPEWHLQCDALELLKMKWDMIIQLKKFYSIHQHVTITSVLFCGLPVMIIFLLITALKMPEVHM